VLFCNRSIEDEAEKEKLAYKYLLFLAIDHISRIGKPGFPSKDRPSKHPLLNQFRVIQFPTPPEQWKDQSISSMFFVDKEALARAAKYLAQNSTITLRENELPLFTPNKTSSPNKSLPNE
jgi:hypothetical protein